MLIRPYHLKAKTGIQNAILSIYIIMEPHCVRNSSWRLSRSMVNVCCEPDKQVILYGEAGLPIAHMWG